jgi:hypothetical protein
MVLRGLVRRLSLLQLLLLLYVLLVHLLRLLLVTLLYLLPLLLAGILPRQILVLSLLLLLQLLALLILLVIQLLLLLLVFLVQISVACVRRSGALVYTKLMRVNGCGSAIRWRFVTPSCFPRWHCRLALV